MIHTGNRVPMDVDLVSGINYLEYFPSYSHPNLTLFLPAGRGHRLRGGDPAERLLRQALATLHRPQEEVAQDEH